MLQLFLNVTELELFKHTVTPFLFLVSTTAVKLTRTETLLEVIKKL